MEIPDPHTCIKTEVTELLRKIEQTEKGNCDELTKKLKTPYWQFLIFTAAGSSFRSKELELLHKFPVKDLTCHYEFEPENTFDRLAIKIMVGYKGNNYPVGYIPNPLNHDIYPFLLEELNYPCVVLSLGKETNNKKFGIRLGLLLHTNQPESIFQGPFGGWSQALRYNNPKN
jgi:hypothetical protein